MNQLKRYAVTGFIFVSILGTLSHFFYRWSGQNPVIGLFSPVNESTWEHMKLLFFPAVLYLFYIRLKLGNSHPGFISAMSLGIIAGTFFIPAVFYIYTGILGHNLLVLDILLFYSSAAITFLMTYKFSNSSHIRRFKSVLTAFLIILAACFIL